MSARALEPLKLAVQTINAPSGVMVGRWPRAAAGLGRQSIEFALEDFFTKVESSLVEASTRAQLLSLVVYHSDEKLAEDVSSAWSSLSSACHYHPYDLPPTEPELRHWLNVAHKFAGSVARESRSS